MNPLYAIMEMPNRWLILAGIAFLAACLGTIAMIAYSWPHALAQIWFYAGSVVTLYFLARAFLEWKQAIDEVAMSDEGEH